MKTIILVRHSEAQKLKDIPMDQLPLTPRGEYLAQRLFLQDAFQKIDFVYSSPYKRAYDTARLLGRRVIADQRLIERILGDKTEQSEVLWEKQYLDPDFKTPNGESLNDVKERMTSFINESLGKMNENETAVVVSHAAAICAYLLNFCTITVTDAKEKSREFSFHKTVIHSGKLKTPSAFILEWDNGNLINLRYL